jgi:Leucine-rich repeat (LRR) protein
MKRLQINILVSAVLVLILGSCTSTAELSLEQIRELGSGRALMFQDLKSTSVEADSICTVVLTARYDRENLSEFFEILYGLPSLQLIMTNDDYINDDLLEGIDYSRLSTVRFISYENSRVTQKMINSMATMPNLESITMRNGMGINSLPVQLIKNKKFKALNLGICLDKPQLINSKFEPITTITDTRTDIDWTDPLPYSMRYSSDYKSVPAMPSQILWLKLKATPRGTSKVSSFDLNNYSNTMNLKIERGFQFMDSIDFSSLKHLKKILIEDRRFNTSQLRKLLEKNANLTSVTFHATGVDSIPECICLQKNLKRLQIKRYSDSLIVPSCFKELEIQYLVLDNIGSIERLANHKAEHIKMVIYADQWDPTSLNKFTAARSLDIELRGEEALPEDIRLHGEEVLTLDISQLKQLEDLRITYRSNAYSLEFPEQDYDLSQLRHVEIQCKLENFPPFLNESCVNLKQLILKETDVTLLPSAVGQWEQLKVLEITHHSISNLPKEIGQLKNLEYLLLSRGMLETIDADFSGMDSLKLVDLIGNYLTIGELKKVAVKSHQSYLTAVPPNQHKPQKMLTDELPRLLNKDGYDKIISFKKEYYRPFWRRVWLDPLLRFEML